MRRAVPVWNPSSRAFCCRASASHVRPLVHRSYRGRSPGRRTKPLRTYHRGTYSDLQSTALPWVCYAAAAMDSCRPPLPLPMGFPWSLAACAWEVLPLGKCYRPCLRPAGRRPQPAGRRSPMPGKVFGKGSTMDGGNSVMDRRGNEGFRAKTRVQKKSKVGPTFGFSEVKY